MENFHKKSLGFAGMVLLATAISMARPVEAQTWVHPGVLVSQAQLNYIKAQVAAHASPFYQEFLNAQNSSYGALTYALQGPYTGGVNQCGSNSTPDDGCSAADSDSTAAYVQALLWYITGNQTYANNAITILNAYGYNFKGYAGWTTGIPCPGGTDCSNGPLQAAWDSTKWPRAAEIMRYSSSGWSATDAAQFGTMLANVYEPLIYNGSGDNGNWELSMIEGMMGIAVYNQDSALLAHAQQYWGQRVPAYFYYYPVDGPAPAPFPRVNASTNWNGQSVFSAATSGVAQETCRDMKHTHYGISSAIAAAETDHIQGGTLYASQQARLTTAVEFSAGIDVQGLSTGTTLSAGANFCSSDSNSTEDNTITLGEGYTFVIGYNEYHNRLGQAMPNTAQWISQGVLPKTLPVDVGGHITVFEPLTHYADANSAAANFTLSSQTSSQTVAAGSSTTYGVTMTAVNGYTGTVTLNASGVPAGATASFSPSTVTGSGTSLLTVTTTASTPGGSSSLLISGTDGTLTSTTTTTLVVTSSQTLTITANNQSVTENGTLPTLTYTVSPNVTLDTAPTCVSYATGSSNTGVYPGAITCSGAAKAGYGVDYVAGQMTVLQSNSILITANNQTMSYGGTVPTLTYTVSPLTALHTDPTCVTTVTSSTGPGVYPGTITCSGAARTGDTISYAAGQMTVTQTTSLALQAAPSSAYTGATVTLTATLSPYAAGGTTTNGESVTFYNGGTGLGMGTLALGVATLTTTALPAGTDNLSATYAGDGGYLTSNASTVGVTIAAQSVFVMLPGGSGLSFYDSGGSRSSAVSGGGTGAAVDSSGSVWSLDSQNQGASVSKFSESGTTAADYFGVGISGATALAIDGNSVVWIANGNGTISALSNAGAALFGSPVAAGYLSSPKSISVDSAGSLWVANSGNNTVTEVIGAAAPVATPIVTAVSNGTVGTKP